MTEPFVHLGRDADALPVELPVPAQYVLPLRWDDEDDGDLDELTAYLARLSRDLPVIVVDGSPPALFQAHRRRWEGLARHLPPEPWPGANGKVGGVMTGVRAATADVVVVADDDVRYTSATLRAVLEPFLGDAAVVRPQNVFTPMPWHARWDSARSLVNRALGSDYPGTLAVRRSALLAAGGYDGDVMFENLELIRTVRAGGGTEVRADDALVPRRPPSARTFWSQRVRQAYDDLAQPGRLAVEAAVLPLVVWSAATRRLAVPAGLAAAVVALAAVGRARAGAARAFPAGTVLWAPAWLGERAVCVWVALVMRLLGGVPYRGARIPRAASSMRSLRRRVAARAPLGVTAP
jgi:hypothetical protein